MAARKKTSTKRFTNKSNPAPKADAKDSRETSLTKGSKDSPAALLPKKST